jgi:hypothetical protein
MGILMPGGRAPGEGGDEPPGGDAAPEGDVATAPAPAAACGAGEEGALVVGLASSSSIHLK